MVFPFNAFVLAPTVLVIEASRFNGKKRSLLPVSLTDRCDIQTLAALASFAPLNQVKSCKCLFALRNVDELSK